MGASGGGGNSVRGLLAKDTCSGKWLGKIGLEVEKQNYIICFCQIDR